MISIEQHGTHVGVNDFIAKAAERALQDVTAKKMPKKTSDPIIYPTTASSFAENKKYGGGEFKQVRKKQGRSVTHGEHQDFPLGRTNL